MCVVGSMGEKESSEMSRRGSVGGSMRQLKPHRTGKEISNRTDQNKQNAAHWAARGKTSIEFSSAYGKHRR